MTGLALRLLGGLFSPRGLAALGLAALVIFAGVQTARLGHAKTDLAAARLDLQAARTTELDPSTRQPWRETAKAAQGNLTSCRGNLVDAADALARQAAAVARLRAEAERQQQVSRAALRQAQTGRQAAEGRAAAILALRPGDDTCASALDLLRGRQ